MAEPIEVEILVYGYLRSEIDKLRHGWSRRVRSRKKYLRRQLKRQIQKLGA